VSGVGGDELFGGYPRYLGMAWHARLRRAPGRRIALALLRRLGDAADSRNVRGRLRRFLEGLAEEPEQAWMRWTATTTADWDEMLALPRPPDDADDRWRAWSEEEGGLAGLLARFGPVNGAMAWDRLTYLPDDLLAMGDRMSMAHALELRAPFLDVELADWALRLPASFKVAGAPWREGLKLLLRAVARRRLPPEVVDRPKQGFMAPIKHWLRDPLAGEVRRLTEGSPLGGLVRPEFVRREWARHEAGEDRSDILWGLLLMDAWMRRRDWRF
jgi:asparagine synthase (glutamine-hydrolysing)